MPSLVTAASSSSGTSSLLIFALPLLLIGFMIITQRRRTKEIQRVQSSLEVGTEVMTTSGMLGRISDLDDSIATLEVSPGVLLRFNRRAIAGPAPIPSASRDSVADVTDVTNVTDAPSDPSRPTD